MTYAWAWTVTDRWGTVMAAVCSLCSTEIQTAGPCPRCGGQPTGPTPGSAPAWQQTSWGRIVIGLVVSQGLFYGLRQFLAGALLALQGGTLEDLYKVPENLLALQALQVLTIIAGGVLAGGAQTGAMGLGLVAGAFNGVLAILLRQVPPESLAPAALYGTPLLHAFAGAMGGMIGSWIWKPLTDAADTNPQPVLRKAAKPKSKPLLAGPVAWLRVALGASLAVAGTLYAARLIVWLEEYTHGRIAPRDESQENFLLWEIRALALLVGGAVAGALTRNGLKQGLAVGIAASIVLVGLQTAKQGQWLTLAAATFMGAFSLCMVGGWFGGALFPPVVPIPRRASSEI